MLRPIVIGPNPYRMKSMRIAANRDPMIGSDLDNGLSNPKAVAER